MTKILITGATGTVGSQVLDHLLDLDRAPESLSSFLSRHADRLR